MTKCDLDLNENHAFPHHTDRIMTSELNTNDRNRASVHFFFSFTVSWV